MACSALLNLFLLSVLRRPLSPTGLNISTYEEFPVANITWNPVNTTFEFESTMILYSVFVTNITNLTTISIINTSDTFLHYNISVFYRCGVESIRFSVKSIVLGEHTCPNSKQSKLKEFTDVVVAKKACFKGMIVKVNIVR